MVGEMTRERLQINVENSISKEVIDKINSILEEASKSGRLNQIVKMDTKEDKEACDMIDAIVMYYKRRGIEASYKYTGTSTLSLAFMWNRVDIDHPMYT